MTNEEAIKRLTAMVRCKERTASGIYEDCNCERCVNCNLLYEQGNSGERIEAMKTAISALKAQDVSDTNVGDLISRQAAIDAVSSGIITEKDAAFLLVESPYECNSMIKWAVEELKKLPSVHPEPCEDAVSRQAVINIINKPVIIKAKEQIEALPSVQPTLWGYDIEHLILIADVLRKENLSPRMVTEALTDIGRIVSMVRDEFEETLRKSVEQSLPVGDGF